MELDDAFDFVDVELFSERNRSDNHEVHEEDRFAPDNGGIILTRGTYNIEDDFAFEDVKIASFDKIDQDAGKCPEKETLQCSDCDYTTNKRRTLRYHKKTQHESALESCESSLKAEILYCSVCSYKTDKKRNLRDHIRIRHKVGVEEKELDCAECDYKTTLNRNLRRHMQAVHSAFSEHLCVACGYSTGCKSSLISHTERVHQKSETFRCELCAYKTHYKKNLYLHIDGKHNDSKFFPCSFAGCDYR